MQGNITKEKKPYMRKGWKVLLGLGVCLTGLLWPGTAEAASVKSINRDITVLRPTSGTWDKTNGKTLYFGEPAASKDGHGFRVLPLSSDTQEVMGVTRSLFLECHAGGWNQEFGGYGFWRDSNPRTNFNSSGYYDNQNYFSTLEKSLIAMTKLKTGSSNGYSDHHETQDKVFILSVKEIMTLYPTANDRKKLQNINCCVQIRIQILPV